MLHVTLSRPTLDDPAFGSAWQHDAEAWGASPFLTWPWVGCLAAQRFPHPVLAEATENGAPVARALFNRRTTRLGTTYHLHESGDPAHDATFTEHNGPLALPGHEAPALAAMLRALAGPASRVTLSGVPATLLTAAQATGLASPIQTRQAPYARLDPATPFHQTLSRNTGAQLRRSDRSYAATGPITVTRATTPGQARHWLDRLVEWHEATWQARGIASGFLTPQVQRFHQALLPRGVPTGTVDMLRIAAGDRVIGYLLNLRAAGHVCAYQSGFDYTGAAPHEKPGLTSHAAAAEHARQRGDTQYDFLAGDARYKRSLGNDTRPLHWLTWQRPLSLPGLTAAARRALGR